MPDTYRSKSPVVTRQYPGETQYGAPVPHVILACAPHNLLVNHNSAAAYCAFAAPTHSRPVHDCDTMQPRLRGGGRQHRMWVQASTCDGYSPKLLYCDWEHQSLA